MSLVAEVLLAVSCLLAGSLPPTCVAPPTASNSGSAVATTGPTRAVEALDVVITAESAIVWDADTDAVLYQKKSAERRPIASLVKLLSTAVAAERLSPERVVEIPAAVREVQRQGAHIRLPVGEHARVQDLLAASLIPSANDAIVTLAYAAARNEPAFVAMANTRARQLGLANTKLANATGLPGGEQYSTAEDVQQLLRLAVANPILRPYLDDARGVLRTSEGTARAYTSTNDLLSTYVPILAAKTGYTAEAGENVALLTTTSSGHTIGIVILGSRQRFQDAKIMAEWVDRHYTWPH